MTLTIYVYVSLDDAPKIWFQILMLILNAFQMIMAMIL